MIDFDELGTLLSETQAFVTYLYQRYAENTYGTKLNFTSQTTLNQSIRTEFDGTGTIFFLSSYTQSDMAQYNVPVYGNVHITVFVMNNSAGYAKLQTFDGRLFL
jgi:hypothetical protein